MLVEPAFPLAGVSMIADIKIGITGLPGSGKTYALLGVIEMLKEEELSIGGKLIRPRYECVEEHRSYTPMDQR